MRKAPTFRSSPNPFPHAPYSCRQQNLRRPDFCPYYIHATRFHEEWIVTCAVAEMDRSTFIWGPIMLMPAAQPETSTAIRVDLGAIFVSLELSKSTWLVTSLAPGSEKISRHTVTGGDTAGLFACFADLRHLVALIGGVGALGPTRVQDHTMRTYSGRPSSSIRFSTSAAMATSLACRPSVCERSPSPMTRFQREMSDSTRARQLYPGLASEKWRVPDER